MRPSLALGTRSKPSVPLATSAHVPLAAPTSHPVAGVAWDKSERVRVNAVCAPELNLFARRAHKFRIWCMQAKLTRDWNVFSVHSSGSSRKLPNDFRIVSLSVMTIDRCNHQHGRGGGRGRTWATRTFFFFGNELKIRYFLVFVVGHFCLVNGYRFTS